MSTPAPAALASEARRLITEGRFAEAQEVVLAYCDMLAKVEPSEAAVQEARRFLNWAIKAATAMRSHALLHRSELRRAAVYGAGRHTLKTWEIVS
jgi:hypothetical protein